MHLNFPPRFLAPAASFLYGTLRRSVRWQVEDPHGSLAGAREGTPRLFLCRHGQLLPLLWAIEGIPLRILVSRSGDGELLARLLLARKFELVRGSSSGEGVSAGRAVYRTLAAGVSVGLAADGPRGPLGSVHESVLRIARRSGVAVVGLRVEGDSRWEAPGSWDRFELPLPGRRLRVVAGPPRLLSAGDTALVAMQAALEDELAGRAVLGRLGRESAPELGAAPGWSRL
jgi:lysophospholipid acyltransferase (LPLAT)-like uncharacterized protein